MQRAGLLLFLVMAASPNRLALAGESEITSDVRCVIVGMEAAQTSDSAKQQTAMAVTMYFLGQLNVIAPQADLDDLMSKQLTYLTTPLVLQAEATRCGQVLVTKAQLLQQIGTHLIPRIKELLEKQAAPLP